MATIRVHGWITPEGYGGHVLHGEVLSRPVKVDLTVDLPRIMLVKVGNQLVLTVGEED